MKYKGWNIEVRRQVLYPPFKPFVGYCSRKVNKRLFLHNLEGNSEKQVVAIAQDRIDNNEFDCQWTGNLTKCVFE